MPSSVKENESAVVKEKAEESAAESFDTAPGEVAQKSEVKAPDNKERPRRQRGGGRRRNNNGGRRRDNSPRKNNDDNGGRRQRDNSPRDNNNGGGRRRDNSPRNNNADGGGRRRYNSLPRGNRYGGERRQRNFTNEGVPPADRQVLAKGLKGVVAWYSVRDCYGFIKRSDKKEEDVFVHQMNIIRSHMYKPRYRSLAEGEEVEFDLAEGRKGRTEAINVTGPGGKNVIGTSIIVRYGGRYGPQVVGVDEANYRPRFPQNRRDRNNRRRDDRKEGNETKEGEEKADDKKSNADLVATQTSASDTKLTATESSSTANEKENAPPASPKVESGTVQKRIAKWNGPNGGGNGASEAAKTNNNNGTAAGDGIEVKTSNPAAGNGTSEVHGKNEAEA